jgi:uncharacterized protein YcnI
MAARPRASNDIHQPTKGLIMHALSNRTIRSVLATSAVAALTIAIASPASAHVGVDLHGATPTAGSSTSLWLRPGHGCDGDATNTITITVPAGATSAKAQPKAGWKLTSDGTTITWTGNALPDDQFDDFGVRLSWPKLDAGVTSKKFYFKVVQTCNAEIKVTREGSKAVVTGWLPSYAGESVALFVDGIPLTKNPVTIDDRGAFSVATTSDKVPEGADVTASYQGRTVGNSIRAMEAWTNMPGDGTDQQMPAPSVTVNAPSTTSSGH